MHLSSFLTGAFVYLAAAVIAAPIAARLGLGSVLGYLAAGVLIGPAVLGLVGSEGQDVMHFAEFGVIVMLFLVGLELQPSKLLELREPILGLGGLQVLGTACAIAPLTASNIRTCKTERPPLGAGYCALKKLPGRATALMTRSMPALFGMSILAKMRMGKLV